MIATKNYVKRTDQNLIKVSWMLTVEFDEQIHLFSGTIKTNYKVDVYICSCGHNVMLVRDWKQKVKYKCSICDNFNFYDAYIAWRNLDHFLLSNQNIILPHEYDVRHNKNGVKASYIIKMPTKINFMRGQIVYEKKSIYSLELTNSGELKKAYETKENIDIFKTLKSHLLEWINKSHNFDIPYPENEPITLNQIQFFLGNRHLKELNPLKNQPKPAKISETIKKSRS